MPRFTRAIWNELRDLSSQEVEIIRRFETDSKGTLFVAAAEVLRKRGYIDETIVIMEDGVRNYPQYHSARAALARDYFLKGLMAEAMHHVTLVVQKSIDNAMAQRLKLKLDVLFQNRDEVRSRLTLMKQLIPDDDFTRHMRDLVALDDWGGARTMVISELERIGIRWNSDMEKQHSDAALDRLEQTAQRMVSDGAPDSWEIPTALRDSAAAPSAAVPPLSTDQDGELPAALRQGSTLACVKGDPERYLALRGFRRVHSEGLFASGILDQQKRSTLDHTTLAEIYATQGLYAKAIAIYERALRQTPEDTSIKSRLDELREGFRTAQIGQAAFTPIQAKAMRMSPDAERKLRFLETLLNRLEQRSKTSVP